MSVCNIHSILRFFLKGYWCDNTKGICEKGAAVKNIVQAAKQKYSKK